MMIGSTHGVGGNIETQCLSTVVAQIEPIHASTMEEVNKNIDQIIAHMEIGTRGFPGYDLFVSPEFGVQGIHPLKCQNVLLTIDSMGVRRLQEACARLRVWGIFDVLLKEEGHMMPSNTALMINDKGEIVHRYVKMNPWTPAERFYPGSEMPVTPGPKGSKIATLICADGDYPECWREAAYNGANVIVRIAFYSAPWEETWRLTNRAAAFNNQCYVIACNGFGIDHNACTHGTSMIINPDGNVITEAPVGRHYIIKADIYPGIVDKFRESCVSSNFLYAFRHRGAACRDFGGHGKEFNEYKAYDFGGED